MKETTRSALIAGLAVLAVSFAAATLDSTVVPESGSSGGSGGNGGSGGGVLPVSDSPPGETVAVPYLAELFTLFLALTLLAALVYALYDGREALAIVLGIVLALGLLLTLVYLLASSGTPGEPPERLPAGDPLESGEGDGGGSDASRPGPSTLFVLLVLGLGLAGAVLAVVRTRTGESDDDDETSDEDGPDDAVDPAAVGRAAGRAADRLERETDLDNEVYRAWRELTDLLEVDDPETSTPAEFADAAVEAGLGREDVTELTRLFEDVRYGGAEPSAERERRAIEIFRRIEDRYAEGET